MEVIRTVELLREFARTRREVALVPTMGNLHEGHASLIEAARKKTPNVVVSVFVNPTQFGQGEDYESYPRTPETDAGIAEEMGAAAVFAPSVKEMYPEPQNYFVEPPALAHELCGVTRPIHFRGVCTVVLKLLIAADPRWAFFGKKDYQQLVIVKGMARQFNLPVEIVGVEILQIDTPLRHRTVDEIAIAFQSLFQHPFRLVLICGNSAHDILVNAFFCRFSGEICVMPSVRIVAELLDDLVILLDFVFIHSRAISHILAHLHVSRGVGRLVLCHRTLPPITRLYL